MELVCIPFHTQIKYWEHLSVYKAEDLVNAVCTTVSFLAVLVSVHWDITPSVYLLICSTHKHKLQIFSQLHSHPQNLHLSQSLCLLHTHSWQQSTLA